MNTLTKIIEKPVERIKERNEEKRNYKKFQDEKRRIETSVNSRIEGHNSEYRKCEKTSDEGIEDRWYVRKYLIDNAKEIHSLARQYNIKDYDINFKKLD